MTDLLDLYGLAEEHGTEIYWFDLGTAESLSLPLEDGSCAIAMDPWRMPTLADEKVKLAHELGHCETGSFYNRYAAGISARNMRTGPTNGHTKSSSRRTSWQKPVSRDIVSPGNWPNILV